MKPLIRSTSFKPRKPAFVIAAAAAQGVPIEEAEKMLDAAMEAPVYVNDLYQVQATEIGDGWTHLNIRRRDGRPIFRDWRHFQQIKNEVCGTEREAMEMYPAESRLVDSSNKYHLWVGPPGFRFPFGWDERDVRDDDGNRAPGMRQRKFEGGLT